MPLATLPDDAWIADVGAVAGLELVPWRMREPHPRRDEIGLVVPPYLDPQTRYELLQDLATLDVVQLLTAGYEQVAPHLPPGARLCNGAGIHDASTAELTVTLILASLRGIPDFVAAQRGSHWIPTRIWPALADRKVAVVGYGHVGRAIVRRLLPFEVAVTAVASRGRAGDDLVPEVFGIDDLPTLLPEQDVVVLITPLTAATEQLVDAAFLRRLHDGALLVNMARGRVVDTDALVAELATGRISAALDVTEPEPLPPDHPLWRAPNLLLSPHVGGATTAFRPRAVALLRRQLKAHASGRPLDNVVAGPPAG